MELFCHVVVAGHTIQVPPKEVPLKLSYRENDRLLCWLASVGKPGLEQKFVGSKVQRTRWPGDGERGLVGSVQRQIGSSFFQGELASERRSGSRTPVIVSLEEFHLFGSSRRRAEFALA
jgi:hypothetical protein